MAVTQRDELTTAIDQLLHEIGGDDLGPHVGFGYILGWLGVVAPLAMLHREIVRLLPEHGRFTGLRYRALPRDWLATARIRSREVYGHGETEVDAMRSLRDVLELRAGLLP